MSKKFLVGVANVSCFDIDSGDLLFKSKTLLDSSIDIQTSSQEVSGGAGNSLQYIYFHSGRFNVKLTDVQFSLNSLAKNVGSSILTSKNIWMEETVILGEGGTGTVLGTPLLTPDVSGTDVYGYVTDKNGTTTKVTFSTKDFTLPGGASGDFVCVQYYALNSAARYVTINSNFLPAVVRMVLDCQLASSDEASAAGASIIGKIQFEIARLQLSGAQAISMTSSGVANTPLEGMALSYAGTGSCANSGIYGTVTEIIDSANWYDRVNMISFADDSISVATGADKTLEVWAIPNDGGAAFKPPVADLSFTSSDATKATVGLHTGIVHGVGAGSAIVTCAITSKNTVTANADITIT
jgi:hypothetical protein